MSTATRRDGSGEPDLRLADRDLRAIMKIVYERSGITLTQAKRPLVVARLQKRLRTGGFASFRDYVSYVEENAGELTVLLDAIATNHTSFFRESQHFAFLAERVVAPWLARQDRSPLAGWSAPCSTGEEAYSLAITLLEATPASEHGRLRIDACDLSTKAVRAARAAVYPLDRVHGISKARLQAYFEKGLGEQAGLARVKRHVRALVDVKVQNLLEVEFLGRTYDFIFCRNVMIYFDKAVQQRVVSMLERHLAVGGHLFIAHSESLNGIRHGLEWVAPAVYWKRRA